MLSDLAEQLIYWYTYLWTKQNNSDAKCITVFQTPLVTETEMEVDDSKQGKALIPLETGSGECMDLHTIRERINLIFICDWLMSLAFKEMMMT